MGSWNETCMVTNLPIERGDSVVAFVLQKSSQCTWTYATDPWNPLSAAIFGTYDDYGRVLVSGELRPSGQAFLNVLGRDKADSFNVDCEDEFKTEAAALHEAIECEKWNSDIDLFHVALNAIERGDVYKCMPFLLSEWRVLNEPIALRHHVAHRVALTMVHRKVYDLFIQQGEQKNWCGISRSGEFEKIDPFLAALRPLADDRLKFYFDYSLKYMEIEGRSLLPQSAGGEGYPGLSMYDYMEQLRSHLEADQLEWCKSFLQDCIDVAVVSRGLSETRKFWTPTIGKGSQDSELDLHKKLARLVTDHTSRSDEDS